MMILKSLRTMQLHVNRVLSYNMPITLKYDPNTFDFTLKKKIINKIK